MTVSRREWMTALFGAAFCSDRALAQNVKYPRPDDAAVAFWEPCDRAMIDWLRVPAEGRVLDAGCGFGHHLVLLAEKMRGKGQLVGIDRAEGQVASASAALAAKKLSRHSSAQVADLYKLPFPDASFDLIWTSHVIHGQEDMAAAVRALLSKLKPGGRLAVRENRMSANFLPYDLGFGRPGWEYRTDLNWLDWYTKMMSSRAPVGKGWADIFRAGGAAQVTPKSFLLEVTQPFTAPQRRYIQWHLERRFEWPGLAPDDLDVLRRLTNPDDDQYVFRRTDLYYTQLSTVYVLTKS